jgi:murein DD-endopeptidase MepM/ murein hydrolase activator NlpD
MLRTFKLKLLGVIVIAAVLGILMQFSQSGSQFVQPALQYIMDNKYDVRAVLARYVQIPGLQDAYSLLPVSGGALLRQPCEIVSIQSHFGWHWDQQGKKSKFNPGMQLNVVRGTEVKPILSGQVVQVTTEGDQKTVLIKHDNSLFSLYGGLQQAMVRQGASVGEDTVIGKTGESLYFEVRGKDGPVDPQSIFK